MPEISNCSISRLQDQISPEGQRCGSTGSAELLSAAPQISPVCCTHSRPASSPVWGLQEHNNTMLLYLLLSRTDADCQSSYSVFIPWIHVIFGPWWLQDLPAAASAGRLSSGCGPVAPCIAPSAGGINPAHAPACPEGVESPRRQVDLQLVHLSCPSYLNRINSKTYLVLLQGANLDLQVLQDLVLLAQAAQLDL